MIIARRYLIGGRVQGVGFRLFTENIASQEGIRGFVRNLHDGRVEALAEGEVEELERFEKSLREGPPSASVEMVEIEPMALGIRRSGFDIL